MAAPAPPARARGGGEPPRARQCDLNSDHTERKSITSQLCHQHPLLRFLSPTLTEPQAGSSTARETNTRALVVPGTEPSCAPAEKQPGLTQQPSCHASTARAGPDQQSAQRLRQSQPGVHPTQDSSNNSTKKTVIKLHLRHFRLLK